MKTRINRDAQALAKLLQPAPLSEKVGDGDFAAAKAQMIRIITALDKTKRGAGPSPDDLLETAWGFRDDVGRVRFSVFSAAGSSGSNRLTLWAGCCRLELP